MSINSKQILKEYNENEVMSAIKDYQNNNVGLDENWLSNILINIILNEPVTLASASKLFNIPPLVGVKIVNKHLVGFDEEVQNRVHTILLKNRKKTNIEKKKEDAALYRLTKLVRLEKINLAETFCKSKAPQIITPLEVVELLFYYYADTCKIHLTTISISNQDIFISYRKSSKNNIIRIDSSVSKNALIKLFGDYNIGEKFILGLNYILKKNIVITDKVGNKFKPRLSTHENVKLSFIVYYSYIFIKKFNGDWNYYVKSCDEYFIVLAQKDKVIEDLMDKIHPEDFTSCPFLVFG